MMTTENIYKEPSAPEKPKRHRRTKAEMASARATSSGSNPIAHATNGTEQAPAQPFIHAQAAADWLCTNLLENSPGWQIGDALRRSLGAQP